jgi:hypothetical protein
MWMEWTVPIQKLELQKITPGALTNTTKPLTPLEYKDGPFHLKHLNILLPPLVIKEYDTTTGRLTLTLPENSAILNKMMALQESLLLLVHQHQKSWFPDSNRTKENIQHFFQPFVEGHQLNLYCPLQSQDKKYFLHIWKEGVWTRLHVPGILQKGDILRVALRLQGISYQTNPQSGSWTGRFRVQHRIMCIYHCSSKSSSPVATQPQTPT